MVDRDILPLVQLISKRLMQRDYGCLGRTVVSCNESRRTMSSSFAAYFDAELTHLCTSSQTSDGGHSDLIISMRRNLKPYTGT